MSAFWALPQTLKGFVSSKVIKDDMNICEVLDIPDIVLAFKSKIEIVIQYFQKHIKELFDICFDDSNGDYSIVALRILIQLDNPLAQVIVDKDILDSVFNELYEIGNHVLIGRFASVMTCILSSNCHMEEKKICFVPKILEFGYVLDVFYMFKSFFTNHEKFVSIRCHLQSFDFPSLFINQIVTAQDEEMQVCMLNLIRYSLYSQLYQEGFQNKNIVLFLKTMECFGEYSEDAKWSAIESMCENSSPLLCIPFLDDSLTIISNAKNVRPKVVYAINVAKCLIQTNPNILNQNLLHDLYNLLYNNPMHSILLASIYHFLSTAIGLVGVDTQIALFFIPSLIKEASERENGLLGAFSMRLLMKIDKQKSQSRYLDHVLSQLGGYESFVQNEMKEYRQIIESDYGGKAAASIFDYIKNFIKG